MSKAWDSNILKKLKTLVGKGLSTAEIGKKLGMSKNAIVGKLHRLGWSTGASDGASTRKSAKATAKKAGVSKKVTAKKTPAVRGAVKKSAGKKDKVAVSKKTEDVTPKSKGRAIAGKKTSVHQRVVQHALEMAALKPNQCRWPIGDPDSDGFHFCGQPVFVGKPYCYEHCKQAYQFVPPKKK